MLNGCASGVAVVNIDNGFGTGAMANSITTQRQKAAREARVKNVLPVDGMAARGSGISLAREMVAR